MSYYNSIFDIGFKRVFSSSYVNFTNNEIKKMALKILSESTIGGSCGQRFVNIKEIHKKLVDKALMAPCEYYNETYKNYLKSTKLLELFNVSFDLLQISSNTEKKKFTYSKLRKSLYNKEVNRYAVKENIPIEFASLSLDRNCIKHLVGFFIKKIIKISFNIEILDSCKKNIRDWQQNTELLTPYERTGRLQKYLYIICNEYKVSKHDLPPKLMRIILSTARLHFSIMDEIHVNPSDLLLLLKKQKEEAFLEEINGYSIYSNSNSVSKLQNKKYIKNWRVRHLKPFLGESSELEYISKLKNTDPIFDVKLVLLGSKLLNASDLIELSE